MTKAKTLSRPAATFWGRVSDDELISRKLIIASPSDMPPLVTTIPDGDEELHVEAGYDFSGTDDFQTCVHGHKHLKGLIFRKGAALFPVGWMCGETHYGQKFDEYTNDFNIAQSRQAALHRVRDLREAVSQLSSWASSPVWDHAAATFDETSRNLQNRLPFMAQTLWRYAGAKLYDVQMPRYACVGDDPEHSCEAELARMRNEIAKVAMLLTGSNDKAASSIGAVVEGLQGVVRRAERLLVKLGDIQLAFQPSVLEAITQYAENAVPMRAKHYPGLLKMTSRNQVVGIPADFRVPSRAPLDALIHRLNS